MGDLHSLEDVASVQNSQGNALSAPRQIVLTKAQRIVIGDKVGKHAHKHAAIVAIALAGRVARRGPHQRPTVHIGQWRTVLVQVLVLEVAKQVAHVAITVAAKRVVKLNALLVHECHGHGPVLIALIDWKNNLVELENVLA
jgi:hypothetical protein